MKPQSHSHFHLFSRYFWLSFLMTLLVGALVLTGLSPMLREAHAESEVSREQRAKSALMNGLDRHLSSFRIPHTKETSSHLLLELMDEHPKYRLIASPVAREITVNNDETNTIVPHYLPELEQQAKQFLSGLPDGDLFSQEVWIHDKLICQTTYVRGIKTIEETLNTRQADCMGYSRTMAALLDTVGIPCRTITGIANNEAHMWNVVTLDGESYLLDVTWDDLGDGKAPIHRYCNVSADRMKDTHTPDKECRSLWNSCVSMRDNWYIRQGQSYTTVPAAVMALSSQNEVLMENRSLAKAVQKLAKSLYPQTLWSGNTAMGVIAKIH